MTRLSLFSLVFLGFFVFSVVFIRVGFFLGYSLNPNTLLFAYMSYNALVCAAFLLRRIPLSYALPVLGAFIGISLAVFSLSYPLSQTYDLSWDGQGYHQSAIIALANGWNPAHDATIDFPVRLPSQIFAEGYPSALWELQAAVVKAVGWVNAGKSLNFAIAVVSFSFLLTVLRRLSIKWVPATVLALLAVLQPVFIIQAMTYMQDGFGYQLFIIAGSSLALTVLLPRATWPIAAFMFAELLLVSTKYSHLPVAAVLAGVWALVVWNRWLNHVYRFTPGVMGFLAALALVAGVFLYIPYGRNAIAHGYPFYPTNIPELMGSVTFNNVPQNLNKNDKWKNLFYGMFSRSQTALAGDPTNRENVARLKVPFTFTIQEIADSAGLFNNRVGAGGPLYSGLVVLSLVLLVLASLGTRNRRERYVMYGTYAMLGLIVMLSVIAPTPNLFRYVSQLQLIPFVVLIPLMASYKRWYMPFAGFAVITLIAANTLLFAGAVVQNNREGIRRINEQFAAMRSSGKTYGVRAQQFYSTYTLLAEQGVPYVRVNDIGCTDVRDLEASSNTTHYCP